MQLSNTLARKSPSQDFSNLGAAVTAGEAGLLEAANAMLHEGGHTALSLGHRLGNESGMSSNVWLLTAACPAHAAAAAAVEPPGFVPPPLPGKCAFCRGLAFKITTLDSRSSPLDRERVNIPRIVAASGHTASKYLALPHDARQYEAVLQLCGGEWRNRKLPILLHQRTVPI